MRDNLLSIVQVGMFDRYGGAERVAWDLFEAYRARGHEAWLAVGRKRSDDPRVLALPHHEARNPWSRFWWRLHRDLQPVYGRFPGTRLAARIAHRLAEPAGWLDARRGREDFHYPGAWRLLDMTPRRPDILHGHNLHQKYFDLRALPWLSRQVPVVLTLHDAWLLAGHCAHSFSCQRWRTGCGECPDLSIYPAIRRDASAENWRRKRAIYAASRLHVAAPCRWLMQKVEASILAEGIVEARVIPYGVDLSIFRPGDSRAARAALGLPMEARVLLFAASGIRGNIWKDYQTMRAAVGRLGERLRGRNVLFVALGENSPPEQIGGAEIRFVPFQSEPAAVARYYQAADLYVHAARADTFPNTVLEALACGTPVVATAVGGIPEQVRSLPDERTSGGDGCTGALVPVGDAEALARRIEHLLQNEDLRRRLADHAADDARRRFDLDREVDEYLGWYQTLLEAWRATVSGPGHEANGQGA